MVALLAALVGMLLGQLVRGRVRPETFRLWFFIGLLLLGGHLALRGLLCSINAINIWPQDLLMKIVDLSHVMNVHTPGWVGYAGNKMYYAQNLQTVRIVAQRISTALHVGTHFDGAMHATDNNKRRHAHLPLDYLVNRGVVVDISKHMHDWAVITPEYNREQRRRYSRRRHPHSAYRMHKHYEGQPQQDLVRYFCYHPGPSLDTLHWMLKKKIKWWGMDTGSCDHAMNTSIRYMRPDLTEEFTKKHGKTPANFLGRSNTRTRNPAGGYGRCLSVSQWAFQEGLLHAENLGGDIEMMLGKRCVIGAFPWRYEGLEGCPCRIVCFLDVDDNVEAGRRRGEGDFAQLALRLFTFRRLRIVQARVRLVALQSCLNRFA